MQEPLDLLQPHPPTHAATETAALASALAHGPDKATLLYFHSSACQLCRAIGGVVEQERERCKDWLTVSSLSTDGGHGSFAPEMLNYGVTSVPCFVLLKPGGAAVAKSGRPRDKAHVTAALEGLLRLALPPPNHEQQQQQQQQLR